MARAKKKKNVLHEEVQLRRQRIARGTLIMSVIGVFVAVMFFAYQKLADTQTLPIRSVKIIGDFEYLEKQQLQDVFVKHVQGNFFTVNIETVKQAVQTLEWVDQVSIRKRWPDMLVLEVSEHKPLARWNNGGFVNLRGEHFIATTEKDMSHLPMLAGPDGTAMMLAQRYASFNQLLTGSSLRPSLIKVSHRRSWQLGLENGLHIRLGRSQIDDRLKRFLSVYQTVIAKELEKIQSVDMRYTNGFAVRWKPKQNLPEKASGRGENV